MNILGSIPVLGKHLTSLFIVPGESFFFLPYLYHCFFLPLLVIYLIRAHIREWLPGLKFIYVTAVGLFLYALFVPPHMDIPPDAPVAVVRGPWFFLGIQSLLKTVPPTLAGLAMPAVFIGCLLILPKAGGALAKFLHYLVMGAFCLYAVLIIRAIGWGI